MCIFQKKRRERQNFSISLKYRFAMKKTFLFLLDALVCTKTIISVSAKLFGKICFFFFSFYGHSLAHRGLGVCKLYFTSIYEMNERERERERESTYVNICCTHTRESHRSLRLGKKKRSDSNRRINCLYLCILELYICVFVDHANDPNWRVEKP